MKYHLIDDPICDVQNWDSCPLNCEDCERFYDCMEIDDEEPDNLECGFDPYMGCYSDDC